MFQPVPPLLGGRSADRVPTLRILGTVPACCYEQRPELEDHADHSLRLVTAILTAPLYTAFRWVIADTV